MLCHGIKNTTHLIQFVQVKDVKDHLTFNSFWKPNLKPPITSTEQALAYKDKLEKLEPNVTFLMSLYLNPNLTPEEIRKAKAAGIVGVKSYPRGVTTNSDSGIESYTVYYPVFKTMEEVGMILNLHGEIPSDTEQVSFKLHFDLLFSFD